MTDNMKVFLIGILAFALLFNALIPGLQESFPRILFPVITPFAAAMIAVFREKK